MDERFKEQFGSEMLSCVDAMEGLVPGTEEYKLAAESLKTLNEISVKNLETEQKTKDSKGSAVKEAIFKGIDVVLTVANILLPMWFYDRMATRHMQFDASGHIPGPLFKSFMGKLHPTKKL